MGHHQSLRRAGVHTTARASGRLWWRHGAHSIHPPRSLYGATSYQRPLVGAAAPVPYVGRTAPLVVGPRLDLVHVAAPFPVRPAALAYRHDDHPSVPCPARGRWRCRLRGALYPSSPGPIATSHPPSIYITASSTGRPFALRNRRRACRLSPSSDSSHASMSLLSRQYTTPCTTSHGPSSLVSLSI